MSYRENVEQAAVALKRGEDANWELARLTFENTLERGFREQAGHVSMEQWCADVRSESERRFSEANGRLFKAVWVEYGHQEVSDRPEWTIAVRSVVPGAGVEWKAERATERHLFSEQSSPETKRVVFQRLAADPDVIQEAAMLGTPTSRAVSDLYTKTERVREEHRERETESDPISKRLDQVGAALDLEAACNRFARDLVTLSERFAREINEALPRTGAAREEHLYWVRQAIERARSVLNDLEGYAETGRTDLDAFLSDVLGGR